MEQKKMPIGPRNPAPVDWDKLNAFGTMKLRHLQKHQPNLYLHLVQTNQLQQHLVSVQEQATLYLEQAINAGRDPNETDEVIRETWISQPDVDSPEDRKRPIKH